MKKKFIGYNFLIVIILALVLSALYPLFNNINYGLDLQGGFEVLYQVEPLEEKELSRDMVINTYRTMLKRIDILGVSEPDIIIEGNDRIRVRLAGVTNREEAREILSKTASLTFRDTNDRLLMTSDVLDGGMAKLTSDDYGLPAVLLAIKDKTKFFEVTNKVKDFEDNRIVIWLDFEEGKDSYRLEAANCGSLTHSKCLSAATVEQAFASDVRIFGNFTRDEASTLVELINSGSIPTKLEEISSRTVGAAFGENSLTKTLTAGIIGILLVILFITIIYRFAGLIAGFGIVLYTFLVFLIFWLIGGVLTLPGIASLVLGIGMAIDACVISFERIKEELRQGNSLKMAFKNGYQKSLSSIIDANITTFVVAVIMFIFGESSVKGFATMLIISIIITIIVMVFIIKYVLKIMVETEFFNNKTHIFINIKEKKSKSINLFKNINFFSRYKFFMAISSIIIIIGIISSLTMNLNLSVDYRGGSYITLIGEEPLNIKTIKNDIIQFGYQYNEIDHINDKAIYIKLDDVLSKEEIMIIDNHFIDNYDIESEIGVISNIVRKELTLNALYSIIVAAMGMIIYISIRFRFSYALSALIAIFHDALIIFAIFSIFNIEIAVIFIAAILAIIGYSINDSVVIFDRIRENLNKLYENKKVSKEDLIKVVNQSLRENLTRTIYTSFTTLLPVLCLIIFGTFEIINFNIALLIGILVGTYSSLFLSCQIWYLIEKNKLGKHQVAKKVIFDELDEVEIKGINK